MSKSAEQYAEAEQEKNLATVGGRIRYARKLRQMTQEDLGRAIPGKGKGRAIIGQYEADNITPAIDVIEALAVILEEDPAFLAFGVEREGDAQANIGRLIPVGAADDRAKPEGRAVIPYRLLAELKAGSGDLRLLRVAVSAPVHGLSANDYVVVDQAMDTVMPDGRLYAIDTSSGLAVMRSEPLIMGSTKPDLLLTSGVGITQAINASAVTAVGLVVASLQRRS